MRITRRLGGLLLLVALGGGCDSDQPLQLDAQTAVITLRATNAITWTYNVWDLIEDNNNDGKPDDGVVYMHCERVELTNPSTPPIPPETVPWNFSIEISILRAGETTPVLLTSEEATSVSSLNIAQYHDRAGLAVTVLRPALFANPTFLGGRRFAFSNSRRMPAAHVEVMNAAPNPLVELLDVALGRGRCSTGNQGPAAIDGDAQPFTIPNPSSSNPELQVPFRKGDTIIVQARMADSPPSGPGLQQILLQPPNAISGNMLIDGRDVNLQGDTSGRAISFSFTSR